MLKATTNRKVHHLSMFSPFVDNAFESFSVWFAEVLKTKKWLYYPRTLFIICCWISVDQGIMCCFFLPTSCCETSSIYKVTWIDRLVNTLVFCWLVKLNQKNWKITLNSLLKKRAMLFSHQGLIPIKNCSGKFFVLTLIIFNIKSF